MFGNLTPCDEMVEAVVKCAKEFKYNGYAPSTGTCPNTVGQLLLLNWSETFGPFHEQKNTHTSNVQRYMIMGRVK